MCPKVISPQVMPLLNVPSTSVSSYFLITCCLTDTTYYLTDATDWNQIEPCATSLGSGPSGHVADSVPNTGCQSKFCIEVSSEYAATITAAEYLDLPHHCRASSSSQHKASSTVPTLLKLGSLVTNLTKVLADCDSLASPRKLVRTLIVKQLFQVFSALCQREREIETKTLCKLSETGNIFTKSLGGKLNWPREEKNWFSKDFLIVRQMWRSNIGKRENRILLFMRSIRSSSPNDYGYNRRIYGLIRLKERQ